MGRPKTIASWIWLSALAVLMVIVAVLSMIAATSQSDPVWQGFWAGLSTTCIGVLLTVFIIDRLIANAEKHRRSGLDKYIRHKVSKLAYFEMSIFVTMVGAREESDPSIFPTKSDDGIYALPAGFQSVALRTLERLDEKLQGTNATEWQVWKIYFEKVAREYDDVARQSAYLVEPDVLLLLLQVSDSAQEIADSIPHEGSAAMLRKLTGQGPFEFETEMRTRVFKSETQVIVNSNLDLLKRIQH